MANKIIHKHSSVITDGKAKLPVASQLEYGELAINYAEGVETISMKNSANEIVEIKSTNYLEKIIIDNELVTANALINLENRLKTIENGNLDLDDTYASKETFDEFATASTNAIKALNDSINNLDDTYVSKEGFEEFTTTNAETINTLVDSINETNTNIEENELVIATALIELDDRIKTIENNNDELDEKYTSKTEFNDYVTTSSDAIKALDTLITESNEHFDNVIIENELVTAKALTNINSRLKNIENSNDGLDEKYASKSGFDSFSSTTADALKTLDTNITDINTIIEENELFVSSALTDLDKRLKTVEANGGGGGNVGDLTDYAKADHTHGTITLSGDVTGSGTIGSGTTAINITATVADNSHAHTSANISDSISASSGITSSASGLVQGKAVQAYAAPKTHNHGTITLSGDVTGSATISGTNAVNITATVADNSHAHTSANISDSISTATNITSSATGLVQGKAVHGMVTALESRVAQLEQTIATLQETLANVTAQLANTLTVE